MGLRLITPPIDHALSLTQIKQMLRVDHIDDDVIIEEHMTQARDWIERRTGVKLMTQTWDFIIDAFPLEEIRLPFGPAQSIVQIAYDDADGMEQLMLVEDYYLDDVSQSVAYEPWVFPSTDWPTTFNAINAVRVRFIAGHVSSERVPGPLRSAFHLKVRELYDGDNTTAQVDRLLFNHIQILA